MMRFLLSIFLTLAALCTQNACAAPGDLLFKITSPSPQPGAGFGELVATVDGDILVGEPNRVLGLGINAVGRAYLFDGKSGALKQTFDNPAPMNLDAFARSITGGDGRVFVSTSGTDPRVFAFDARSGDLLHTLRSPDADDGFLGAAMAYDAGALLASDPAFSLSTQLGSVGRAYVFDAANGTLMRTLSNPEPNQGDLFGTGSGGGSLAIVGKMAIIGALLDELPGDTSPEGQNVGRVWVFDTVSGDAKFVLENPNPDKPPPNFFSDYFGTSVAANQNLIVVGAPSDDKVGIPDSGTVYLFDPMTGALRHTLFSPHPGPDAEFGHSIALTPDGDILVGAWNASVSGISQAGHAYLFDDLTGSLLLDIPNPEPGNSAVFGWSVAAIGERIIVGSPAPGAVYVFQGIPEPSSIVLGIAALFLSAVFSARKLRRFAFCSVSLRGSATDSH